MGIKMAPTYATQTLADEENLYEIKGKKYGNNKKRIY